MKLHFVLCACFLWWGTPVADAHDLPGLLVVKSLPNDARIQIEAREKIRATPAGSDFSATNLAPEKAKELVRSLNLPASFESLEAVIAARAIWPQGEAISVCFFDGNADAQRQVMQTMKEVYDRTNLTLDSMNYACPKVGAQIRISFRQAGFWSYVGTDALLIPENLPTMGLQNLDLNLPLNESAKGTARHEGMHSLAALHEHQNPNAHCDQQLDWDRAAASLGWTSQQMQANFRQLLFGRDVVASRYDKRSVMHYQLPGYFWKSGSTSECYLAQSNTQLSPDDIAMLMAIYPK